MKASTLLFAAVLLANGALAPRVAAQETDDAIRIGPGVTSPTLTHKVEPSYTQAARDAHIQGTTLLQLVIDRTGVPRDINVVSPLGFGLDERAIDCVSQWRFKPATKDGKPVKVIAQVQINFRLLGINFDQNAEERRTRFNSIISRLKIEKDGRPTEKEIVAIQQMSKYKLPAAEYVIGIWQLHGEYLPKDAVAGLANIQKAADKNYGPALFFIGNAQLNGTLLPRDSTKGISLIRDAAVLGSTEAQLSLGEMYEKGNGVESDLDRAKRYFRLCAASGNPECQFRLGKLLLLSPQPEEDRLQAVAWLELAKSHNLAAAQTTADSEAAKLTPEQAAWVARLKPQLERKPWVSSP